MIENRTDPFATRRIHANIPAELYMEMVNRGVFETFDEFISRAIEHEMRRKPTGGINNE